MSRKRLIIICTANQVEQAVSMAERDNGAGTAIFSLGTDASCELGRRGMDFKTIEDYGLSDNYITEEGIGWFKSWSNSKIKDGRNIKELLVYKGIPVWWLVNTWLYSSTFFYDSIAGVLRYVSIIERITAAEKPNEVCCCDDGGLSFKAVKRVCRAKNIPLTVMPQPVPLKRRLDSISMPLLMYGKWLRNILRKTYWQFLSLAPRHRKKGESKGKVLMFTGDNWSTVYNLTSGQPGTGDLYFDSVTEILTGKGYEVTHLSYPTLRFRLQVSSLRTGRRQRNIDYKPFEHYLGLRIILKAMAGARNIRKQAAFLDSREFRESLTFHGIPIYALVKDKFSFAFSKFVTEMIAAVETAAEMIRKEKPGLIIVAGESPYDRALIALSKLNGIPVLGYQHGAMHPTNMFYNNDICDICPNGGIAAPYCPIADKLTVDGQYAKDIMLHRAKYPEGDVIVVGQPRYDILARADEIFDKDDVFHRFKLNPAKKLIVWTTDPHEGNRDEYQREADAVYEAIKKLGDEVQLITKLHPGELGAPLHYRAGRQAGVEPIVTEYSVYELLHACDAMITRASTTAIEAAILGKPIIIVNLSGRSEGIPYVKEGIALGSYSRDELAASIKSALYDDNIQAKLKEARQAFVYKYAYLQDGRASQRFADLITDMIQKGQSGLYGGESR